MTAALDISVIIPCYNIASYIERAVWSVLNQAGVSVEVIVINDNSTDDTLAVVSRIDDPRVKIIASAQNDGPGASRNKGIAAASGKWIAIVDGDDVIAPDRFARMLKIAETGRADMVVDNQTVYREADGYKFPMFPVEKFANLGCLDLPTLMRGKISFLKGHPVSYVKPLIASAFIKKHSISYHEDIWIGEDYLFLAELLASGAVCLIDPSLGYQYTIRKGSVSYRMTTQDVDTMLAYESKFEAKYLFDSDAARAQKYRLFKMREMRAYIAMVESLKKKDMASAVKQALAFPSAVLLFWEPVWVRLKKLFG